MVESCNLISVKYCDLWDDPEQDGSLKDVKERAGKILERDCGKKEETAEFQSSDPYKTTTTTTTTRTHLMDEVIKNKSRFSTIQARPSKFKWRFCSGLTSLCVTVAKQ